MYNDDELENEEQEEKSSDNFFVNFYYNNKILVWIAVGILLFIIIMSLLTKGGSNTNTPSAKNYKVSIGGEDIVALGRSINLSAAVEDVPQAAITWSVDNPELAKIDQDGNLAGLKYGKVTVTATYYRSENNKTYSETKIVTIADGDPNIKLTEVTFKDGELFMPVNGTYEISLVPTPPQGYIESISYASSKTNVVTVDSNGKVNAVGEGDAVITFDVNGEFKKSLQVHVDNDYKITEIIIVPTEISFDGELRKMKVGTKEKLSYTVQPDNADKTRLIWTSSKESVLTVDENGWVTALSEGQATVTLSSLTGKKDVINIEVEADIVPVTEIGLSINEMNIMVGQTQTIVPTISPDNASNKALTYVSSNTAIAVVSPNETGTQATISGISEGSTTIIVKSSNGVEKRLNVTVTKNDNGGSSGGSGGSSGGSGGSSGGSTTQGYKITSRDYYGEPYINNAYEKTKPANNGATAPVTVTVTKTDSSVAKLKVARCSYPATSACNANASGVITITNSDSFTMTNVGAYVIRVYEYDSSNNLKRTTDKYIWIKGTVGGTVTGTTGQKPTITCKNPKYNGTSQLIANCSNGKFTNGYSFVYQTAYKKGGYSLTCSNEYGSVSKTCWIVTNKACDVIDNATECNLRTDCSNWNYTYGCRSKNATATPRLTTAPTTSLDPVINCYEPVYNTSVKRTFATCTNGKFTAINPNSSTIYSTNFTGTYSAAGYYLTCKSTSGRTVSKTCKWHS